MMMSLKHFVSIEIYFLIISTNFKQCSILIEDFNAKHSKWCSTDKNNKARISLDNIAQTSGYN